MKSDVVVRCAIRYDARLTLPYPDRTIFPAAYASGPIWERSHAVYERVVPAVDCYRRSRVKRPTDDGTVSQTWIRQGIRPGSQRSAAYASFPALQNPVLSRFKARLLTQSLCPAYVLSNEPSAEYSLMSLSADAVRYLSPGTHLTSHTACR